jgi:hypothetical protein
VSGRESATSEADAARIVAALQAHEQQNGEVSLALESPAGRNAG